MNLDKLDRIFELQKALDERLGFDKREKQTQIDDNFMSTVHEICELHDLSNWKKWKKNKKDFNRDESLDEFADILHFIVQLAISLGFSSLDIFEAYVKKNNLNHKRQDDNY